MAKIQILRAVVNQRLSAAVEEIFVVFETTIGEYEEELSRQRKLLDVFLKPKHILHRADPLQFSDCEDLFPPEQQHCEQGRSPSLDQEDPEPPQIKQQPQELWTNQEGEQLEGLEEDADTKDSIFRITNVKSEYDPEQSQSSHLPLHPAPLPSISTEPDGEGCGVPEPTSDCQPPCSLNSSAVESEDSGDEWKESEGPQSGLKRLKSNTSGKRKREACTKNRESGPLTLDCPDSDTFCSGVWVESGRRQIMNDNIPDLSQEQQSDLHSIPDNEDQHSMSHDDQHSMPHDDQHMPDDEYVPDSESNDDDDFNVDPSILGIPDNGTASGSDTSISALPSTSKLWTSPEDDKAPNAAETSYSESSIKGSSKEKPEGDKLSSHLSIKNYCYVCGKPQSKISRHLRIHKTDAEIAHAFSLPEHSKERKVLLEKIRNKGNFKHNSVVLQSGTGSLKVKRRTRAKEQAGKFIHCMYCQGMYIRKELWRHVRRCPCKPGKEDVVKKPGRTKVLGLAVALQSAHCQQISSGVWKLLSVMKQDEIASVVRNDISIIQFAQSLHNKHGQDPKKYEYMRQKLREVGRLLLCLRKEFSVPNLEEAFRPDNFQRVVQAVKKISGFDEDEHSYQTPSLALKLGHALRKICDIIHCRALMAEDEELMKSTDTFKKLHASKWSELVSHRFLSPLRDAKYNKPSTLPFTEDVQKLNQYLEESAKSAYCSQKGEATSQNYGQHAEVSQRDNEADDGDAVTSVPERGTREAVDAALNVTITEHIHNNEDFGSVSSTVDETAPPSKENKAGKKKRSKRVWCKAEVAAVMRHFRAHISKAKLATKNECNHCKLIEGPVLAQRTVQNIRDLVRNRGLAAKKQSQKQKT